MTLGVITNVSSLTAQNSLARSEKSLGVAMERLSTGSKINSASDDAAGLAIAQRLEAQARGLDMAGKNAVDGQALIGAVDSAMEEVDDILQRMRELAVQAVNGTNNTTDRARLQTEVGQLQAELTRVSTQARFNNELILDGNLSKSFQVGINGSETVSFSQTSVATSALGAHTIDVGPQAAGTHAVATSAVANAYTVDVANVVISANGLATNATTEAADSAKDFAEAINAVSGTTGVSATAQTDVQVDFSASGTLGLKINSVSIGTAISVGASTFADFVNAVNAVAGTTGVTATNNGTTATLTAIDGEDIVYERTDADTSFTMDLTNLKTDGTTVTGTINLADTTGSEHARSVGRVVMTADAAFSVNDVDTDAAAQNYTASASDVAATAAYISTVDVSTAAGATSAIAVIDGALSSVANSRATLGALDNRLTHVINHNADVATATRSALSKLQDADYSIESANLAKAQVLMQAGTAMLAQANASPQLVLQLIQ